MLWLRVCKGKTKLEQYVRAMGNQLIEKAGTNQKAGEKDVENIEPNASSVENQPREVQRGLAEVKPRDTVPIVFELAGAANR